LSQKQIQWQWQHSCAKIIYSIAIPGTQSEHEFGVVGIWTTIHHRQQAPFVMQIREIFICKGGPINGFSAGAIELYDVTSFQNAAGHHLTNELQISPRIFQNFTPITLMVL